ncbi:MAG: homoserine kinase [Chloroflexi bacterium]|nr:homoserine kinase [Chloroflexota bacterium]
MPTRVSVRVPGAAANLGPGFDCLGLAVGLANHFTFERADRVSIAIQGEGAEELSAAPDNLAYQAFALVHEQLGQPAPSVRLVVRNELPLARGLGSSATAVLGGLLGANALLGDPLGRDEILELACRLEGHPDNVTPQLLGGCTVSVMNGERVVAVRIPVPADLRLVLYVPDFPMPTKEARAVLPAQVGRADAVFNVGRAAMMVAALCTGRLEVLGIATDDRLHQPYRQRIFPALPAIVEAAKQAGALGAFLAGAGSSVMALATANEMPIGQAMAEAGAQYGLTGRILFTQPSPTGAEVSIHGD